MHKPKIKTWEIEKQEIERKHGTWITYDLVQNAGKFLIAKPSSGVEVSPAIFFEKIKNCVLDFSKKPMKNTTILDLGCMEGQSSLVFAQAGANSIISVDGRVENIAKAKFAQKTFGLNNIDFKTIDIRKLNYKKGSFDIVLALGILYHFDDPDNFKFIENLFKWSREMVVIDTHIAYLPQIRRSTRGRTYHGIVFDETVHRVINSSSIGNPQSFWLTRASLFNALVDVGFTGIYECKYPRAGKWRELDDRLTIIATKQPRLNSSIFNPSELIQPEIFEERDPATVYVVNENIPKETK